MSRGQRAVSVEVSPDGPLLVRGADAVLDDDGTPVPVQRPVVAVCLCNKSQRKPWCDGTHKVLNRAAASSTDRPTG